MMNTESKHVCWNCGCNPQKERRESIATAVLAGLCANPQPATTTKDLIQEALEITDVLIAKLDKETPDGEA